MCFVKIDSRFFEGFLFDTQMHVLLGFFRLATKQHVFDVKRQEDEVDDIAICGWDKTTGQPAISEDRLASTD